MNFNFNALQESLRNGVMQELTAVNNLIERVENIDLGNVAASPAEQEMLGSNLQKLFASLLPLSDYVNMPVQQRSLLTPRSRLRAAARRNKELSTEFEAVAKVVSELRRRVNSDDLRLLRLQGSRARVISNLKFYRLVLLDLLTTVTPDNKGASPSDAEVLKNLQLANHKLSRYLDFPQSYIAEFNESAYLEANPDVKSAIFQGVFPSGLAHFVAHGLTEVMHNQRNRDVNDPVHMMVFPGANRQDAGTIEVASSHSLQADSTSEFPEQHDDDSIRKAVTSLPQRALDELQLLRSSGLVDEAWYKLRISSASDSCAHFYLYGSAAGANPNALFDHSWYSHKYLKTEASAMEAVLHYIRQGDDNFIWPGPAFEPEWYQEAHDIVTGDYTTLAHYVNIGRAAGLNPNSVFDNQYYLESNPDIASSKIDPIEHFQTAGWREGRNPSANFDLNFYRSMHLDDNAEINPVSHYLQTGRQNRLTINHRQHSRVSGTPPLKDMAANLRFFSNKGPDFEEPILATNHRKPLAKAVAFFLPQFYPFAENDKWWGDGFTEWRNVARGAPRFEGHYQPRIPRDLGFYNLTDESTLIRQSELALANGIEAFCFYYYWFNGKRLMDKPLDLFAGSSEIKQDFCIMWANENWTRTWDGFDSEVLIKQDYRDEDEDDFIADTLKYFQNERYLSVDGRPLFILYRPGLVDSAKTTIERWRSKWKKTGNVEPLILMVQGFEDMDPTLYGLDGAVEFPPHKVAKDIRNIHDELNIIDPDYSGNVVSYKEVVNKSLCEPTPDFPLIKTVSPHWDNDARREGCGFTLHGSTPANYQHWLRGAINHARKNPFHGESLVFVNAWNEWAESAYLEPDVHYGHAYLNATQRALHGVSSHNRRERVLLVGHDAYKHGAQMLLLNIADTFKNQFGFDVIIALKRGGPLLEAYEKIAKVYVLESCGEDALLEAVTDQGCTLAITNTCVTGDLLPTLKQLDIKVVSLIHELPRLIAEYKLTDHVKSIGSESDHVVFASDRVEKGFLSVCGEISGQSHILPQGIYKTMETASGVEAEAALKVRLEMGITREHKMVLNVGYADMRKGFDLFLASAREVIQQHPNVHFVWVGGITDELKRWTLSDLDAALAKRIHIVDFTDNVSAYFHAADCFYLSSREDPYPSVVLEALSVGCPAVIYSEATGLERVVDQHGKIVDRNCTQEINRALNECLFNDTAQKKDARIRFIKENYQFDDYCFSLLNLARPDIQKVSVVVPNYNYAQHIEDRLLSVFEQHYPLFEIIVLEDKSPDNSLAVIKDVIARSGRKVKLVVNKTNSGNTFRQWQKGLTLARGELLWIAEADDLASSRFVSEVTGAFNENTRLGFSDSKQIDSDGELLGDSYSFYYRDIDADLFEKSRSMKGEEFVRRAMTVKNCILNVSSVIWRTEALRDALAAEHDAVLAHKLVGDWRLYISVLLARDAQVAYLAKPLNTHRRHAESVTHALDVKAHLDEVSAIHTLIGKSMKLTPEQLDRMSNYIKELQLQFGLSDSNKPDASKAKSDHIRKVA